MLLINIFMNIDFFFQMSYWLLKEKKPLFILKLTPRICEAVFTPSEQGRV